jgi:hypothetical protein
MPVSNRALQVGIAHRNTLIDVHVGNREFQI